MEIVVTFNTLLDSFRVYSMREWHGFIFDLKSYWPWKEEEEPYYWSDEEVIERCHPELFWKKISIDPFTGKMIEEEE